MASRVPDTYTTTHTIHYEAMARHPVSYETHLFVLYGKKSSTTAFYANFSLSFPIYIYTRTQDNGMLPIKTTICGNKDIWDLNPSRSHKSSFNLLPDSETYLRF